MLLSSLGTSIANVGLPTLAQAFNASFQEVQWIVLAYLLAITTLIVSVGRLGDITGRRRLLLAGIFLFTVASVLCGVAPTLWLLIAARAAQGLGAAIMMALTMAFVGETVPKAKTGSAMGLLGTMSAIGTALGPSLGGVLIAGLGWRAIFLVTVPLGMLTFLLAHRYLPVDRRGPKTDRAGFDTVGTLLLALTLAAYALAMTIGRGGFGPLNMALLLAAVFGGYPGFVQLLAFTSMNLERHKKAHRDLHDHLVKGEVEQADAIRKFYDEYLAVLDLSADFYLETVQRVFQDALLARGELDFRGRRVDLAAIRRTALLTVEGERDDICALGQTAVAHDLCTGLRPYLKRHHMQAGVGHYGVFSGRRWETQIYPIVRNFVLSAE